MKSVYGFGGMPEALKLETLEWVSVFNSHRLLSSIGYIPTAEAAVNYYQQLAQRSEIEVLT
jgi:putative transposase